MAMARELEVWWGPAGQCYRVEDGDMYTYEYIHQVVDHLRERGAIALMAMPVIGGKDAALRDALLAAGISVVYI